MRKYLIYNQMSYLIASGGFVENLPLLFMVIGLIIIIYYAARHQMGVNSVFRRVQRLGNLKGKDKNYPGLHGILYGPSSTVITKM